MRLGSIRIENYKGFKKTAPILLGPSFNVVVGQNNAGKSALLQTLRLRQCERRPYRGLSTPPRAAIREESTFEVEVLVSGLELDMMIRRRGNHVAIPVEHNDPSKHKVFLETMFSLPEIGFRLRVSQDRHIESINYPSHRQFVEVSPRFSAKAKVVADLSQTVWDGSAQDSADDLPRVIEDAIPTHIYVFNPERLNLGTEVDPDFGTIGLIGARAVPSC